MSFRNNRRNNRSNRSYRNAANGLYINNPWVKKNIINYIYDSIEVGKYRYSLIDKKEHLSVLNSNKYYIMPNYNGISCLLVFLKIKEKYYSVLVTGKTLAYEREKVDIGKVVIMNIRINPYMLYF